MASSAIEVKVTPPVGTILLNRPDSANALTLSMVEEMRQALGDLHLEKRVRAVIITGAGDVFCEGRDLAEMAAEHDRDSEADAPGEWGEQAAEFSDLLVEMLSLPKPVIAAVNGPATGFGVGLVMASDLVLAVEAAELKLADTRHGLVAGVVTPLLAYRLSAGIAARLAISGVGIDAAEAYRLGIYHELVAPDLLWARGMQLGTECAAGAPQAISLTKRLLLETVGEKLVTDLSSGAVASATARTTEAAKEGMRAYLENRAPTWD